MGLRAYIKWNFEAMFKEAFLELRGVVKVLVLVVRLQLEGESPSIVEEEFSWPSI